MAGLSSLRVLCAVLALAIAASVGGCARPRDAHETSNAPAISSDGPASSDARLRGDDPPPEPMVPQQPPAPADSSGSDATTANGERDATVGGDGSPILLAPLSTAEVEAASLAGELACSFAVGEAAPLLVAMGDVASSEASRGVVKVGDSVEAVAAPGGFDAMVKGVVFSGAGKTLRIEPTGKATGSGESPPVPATLVYDRADGARRTWRGAWTCGP